ncbi:hypothetical protein ASZ78_015996 [Callipepla squamata]|uniref:ZP domain-containing protein n=1 Tax=Callipepla squamata TaxID=9009 RepID=A0A226MU70_CALSU|nr:hypothetical protein ASZ78_015996 [Callipepla squamata]
MKFCFACRLTLFLLFGFLLPLAPGALGDWDLLESVTCLQDRLELELPRELGNHTWHVHAVDVSGEEMMSCDHSVDYEKLLLSVPLVNCTSLEHGQHQLRLLLLLNGTAGEEMNVTYSAQCSAAHEDEIIAPLFVGATNCTKDSMAVSEGGLGALGAGWLSRRALGRSVGSCTMERDTPHCCHGVVLSLPKEPLSAPQVQAAAMTGTLTIDDGIRVHQLSLREAMLQGYSFLADGHRLVFQVAFTATGVVSYKHNNKVLHTVALKLTYGPPEHTLTVQSRMLCAPGTLVAVAVEDETIPMGQLQDNGIALNTARGVELHVSRAVLKSTGSALTNAAVTSSQLEGEKITYENEVRALRSDHLLHRISRDSEFRLTVLCSFSNGDASLSVRVDSPPPLPSSMNQGPLSLILLSYPEDSYRQPYRDDQYPIVRYLQQPIFLEVQVLNRNDPNLHLQLDDCWATASEDPSSLPQWNIVVDG